jgi:hypothetical protein
MGAETRGSVRIVVRFQVELVRDENIAVKLPRIEFHEHPLGCSGFIYLRTEGQAHSFATFRGERQRSSCTPRPDWFR